MTFQRWRQQKISLAEMREYKEWLTTIGDAFLGETVTACRFAAINGRRISWTKYHLARDEQINRTIEALKGAAK